jgi:hypothetical protein
VHLFILLFTLQRTQKFKMGSLDTASLGLGFAVIHRQPPCGKCHGKPQAGLKIQVNNLKRI